MTDSETANEILTVFAQYGFKKTSMQEISRAAGISRQSVYNRFGSKQSVFEWAVMTFVADMLGRIDVALTTGKSTPLASLCTAYEIWADGHFPLWYGARHGAAIRDLAVIAVDRTSMDIKEDFTNTISAFLIGRDLVEEPASAKEKTFVLSLASKALLLETKSAGAFSREMMRVISTTLG